jgi:DNA (cytosine-5)-methyltransferase 1
MLGNTMSDKNRKPKVIDLYAGVGGLSLGAIRAGFDLALAVEWDKHAMKAHEINFPKYKHLNTDIAKLSGKKLLKEAGLVEGELDGLIGGPPCQGFSVIGSRDHLDPRNDLFVKFFKLVKECKPKFFIAENVLGILGEQYDVIRKNALKQVKDDYEVLDPIKFKASDFGAPTSRERVFFIGYRRDSLFELTKEDFEKQKVSEITTVAKALRGLPKRINNEWLSEEDSWRPAESFSDSYFKKYVDGNIPEGMGDEEAVRKYKEEGLISGNFGTRHSPEVYKRYKALKPGQTDTVSRSVRLKSNGLCPTLRAGTGSDKGSYQAVRPIHPTAHRVITPREAARLQGFPDWFQFAPSKWHSFRQIGNSVSPVLAEKILLVVIKKLSSK